MKVITDKTSGSGMLGDPCDGCSLLERLAAEQGDPLGTRCESTVERLVSEAAGVGDRAAAGPQVRIEGARAEDGAALDSHRYAAPGALGVGPMDDARHRTVSGATSGGVTASALSVAVDGGRVAGVVLRSRLPVRIGFAMTNRETGARELLASVMLEFCVHRVRPQGARVAE